MQRMKRDFYCRGIQSKCKHWILEKLGTSSKNNEFYTVPVVIMKP